MMKGILIDIEGLDGSGKETQAQLLYEYIKDKLRKEAEYVSFPNYQSESSALVKMYLEGKFGSDPFAINAFAASSFFAVDRFLTFANGMEKDYQMGKWIVANRYTSSNAFYQMPKLEKHDWENYLTWVYDYEYNKLGLPKPDIVIYLDVPVDISQKLMDKRYGGDSSKKDLHESNLEFLKRCEMAAKYSAKRDEWNTIQCVKDRKLKSVEAIHEEIVLTIKNKYSQLLKFSND